MGKFNDIQSVEVEAEKSNLNIHDYTEIYGGLTGCTININGTTIEIGGSSSIFLSVKSVSGGCGCYLLGVVKDVIDGSPDLGSISPSDEPPKNTNYIIYKIANYIIHSGGFKILYNTLNKLLKK